MSEAAQTPESDRVPGYPHPRETTRLIGQASAEREFLAAWAEGRLHHGWLLRGPRGVGKATLAYRIARALIADGPGGETALFGPSVPASLDPPEGCTILQRIRAQSEPRLTVLRRGLNERGRLRTQISVDDVRGVRRFLSLSAADGGWRVVIVDAADEMNRSAANALLKVLEEPPARTALLLVAHAPAGLLPTIRSRCRTLDLHPLEATDLAQALDEVGAPVPAGDAKALALLAGGSVGEALRLIAGDGVALYGRLIALFNGGRGVERGALMALTDWATGRNAESRFDLVPKLTLTLIGRLARHGAMADALPGSDSGPDAVPEEAPLMQAVARSPAQAALWAEASARIAAATAHARAVNLDPGQTIIDTFLELDATLARARNAA